MVHPGSQDFDLSDRATVDAYDELPLWSAMGSELLLRHVPLRRAIRVIDIGCGTGFPALELAERLGPTSTVIGIDPWGEALARARRKADVRGITNVQFIEGSCVALPFSENSFDLIVSNLGVNNFSDPVACLNECRRVARPGARLALTTNLRGHMKEFYSVFRSVLGGRHVELLDRHIDARLTIPRLATQLTSAGFEIARTEESTSDLRFADGTALLRHSFIRLAFVPAWRDLVPVSQRVALFAQLEDALNATAAVNGTLNLSVPFAYIEAVPIGWRSMGV